MKHKIYKRSTIHYSCSAPLWSPRGVMSCFATSVRGALGSQTLLQVSVTTRSKKHMLGSLCFAALSTPYFCCVIAQCTRAHAAWQWRTPRARTWASYRWSLTVHHAPPCGMHRRCRSCCRASTHPFFSEGEHLSVARRVPVCAGSCALACAGASGEQRGPWSGRLLYLTSTYFVFLGSGEGPNSLPIPFFNPC